MSRSDDDDGAPRDWLFATVWIVLVVVMMTGTILCAYFFVRAGEEIGEDACYNIDAPGACD